MDGPVEVPTSTMIRMKTVRKSFVVLIYKKKATAVVYLPPLIVCCCIKKKLVVRACILSNQERRQEHFQKINGHFFDRHIDCTVLTPGPFDKICDTILIGVFGPQ